MKTNLLKLCIAFATAFMFAACEKTQTPDNNPTNNDSISTSDNLEDQSGDGREPEMCLMLVKFTDDKYREHIIATKITSKTACMRSFRPPVVEELIVGSIPFADKLPNEYWITNWRWSVNFIYPPYDVLLPDKWVDMTHWAGQTWDVPENSPLYEEYIASRKYIRRRTIDDFLSIEITDKTEEAWLYGQPPYQEQYVYDKDIPEQTRTSYYDMIHMEDSLHLIYVQKLMDIVQKGDFEKLLELEKTLK